MIGRVQLRYQVDLHHLTRLCCGMMLFAVCEMRPPHALTQLNEPIGLRTQHEWIALRVRSTIFESGCLCRPAAVTVAERLAAKHYTCSA